MTRAGSAITPAEAKASYEEIVGALDYFLKRGYGINTEFVNVRPVIPGVFHGDDDKFEKPCFTNSIMTPYKQCNDTLQAV
jgi:hypothetical protein